MAALSKSTRDSIRNKVLKHRFQADEEKLLKARDSAGDRVYDALYSKADRELMNTAPDGFFAKRVTAWIYPPGSNSGSGTTMVQWTGGKPQPYVDVHGSRSPKLSNTEQAKAIWNAYIEASQAVKALEKLKDEARRELDGVLAGFNTFKQLRDSWPELSEFIPPDPVRTTNALVRVKDSLNQKYKLPPKGKKREGTSATA